MSPAKQPVADADGKHHPALDLIRLDPVGLHLIRLDLIRFDLIRFTWSGLT
jgi:hypothetical protein